MGWWDRIIERQQPGSWAQRVFNGEATTTPAGPLSRADVGKATVGGQRQPAQINRGEWWTSPQLGSQAGQFQLPEWAAYPGSGFTGAADFYSWYQRLAEQDPDFADTALANLRSAYTAYQGREANRAAARTAIESEMDRLGSAMELFQADPFRTAAMESLQEMATPGYEMFGPREVAADRLSLAQIAAQNLARQQAAAAGRGISGGGASAGAIAGAQSAADVGGLMLGAAYDRANREAQLRAASTLAQLTQGEGRLGLSYDAAIASLANELARMEAEDVYLPQDYSVWDQLAAAQDLYDTQIAREGDAFDTWLETQKPNWLDFLNLGIQTLGTGLWGGGG